MTKLILPKKNKINETEEIAMPVVKCDSCGKMTQTGLHQTRLVLVKKSYMKKHPILGWQQVPPVMKRADFYMCTDCVEKGKKWKGERP